MAGNRKVIIAVDIGRYHFITWDGWHLQWDTETPREWWQKQQWEKEGGWSQDEGVDSDRHKSA